MRYVSIFATFFIIPPALSESNALVIVVGCMLALAGLFIGGNA